MRRPLTSRRSRDPPCHHGRHLRQTPHSVNRRDETLPHVNRGLSVMWRLLRRPPGSVPPARRAQLDGARPRTKQVPTRRRLAPPAVDRPGRHRRGDRRRAPARHTVTNPRKPIVHCRRMRGLDRVGRSGRRRSGSPREAPTPAPDSRQARDSHRVPDGPRVLRRRTAQDSHRTGRAHRVPVVLPGAPAPRYPRRRA